MSFKNYCLNKKMKKYILKFIPVFALVTFFPLIASAACEPNADGLAGAICKIQGLLASILPLIVSFGVIYFIWGIVQYFIADGEEAKKNGKDRIIYGIIGLAVIISIWGLVNIVTQTFGLEQTNAPDLSGLVNTGKTTTCTLGNNPKFDTVLNYFTCIIGNSVIPFIFSLAVVMFTWGAVKFFIINSDEEKKRAEGKQFMIWGIIALAVMISIWGLVGILGDTFSLDNALPQVQPRNP